MELLLCHHWLGFKPNTNMDQGGVNALLMSIELAAIGWGVLALANCTMAKFVKFDKIAVNIRP